MLDIDDKYTAYCFNEAVAYIIRRLENGDTPMFKTHYKNFSSLYSQIG